MWEVFVILVLLGITGLGVYNVRSLIRKWKHNPGSWFDLLIGILIWALAIGLLTWQAIVRVFM
jgi:hypothetical protein